MVLGMGMYGQTSTLSNTSNTDIGAPVSGPGEEGPITASEVRHLFPV